MQSKPPGNINLKGSIALIKQTEHRRPAGSVGGTGILETNAQQKSQSAQNAKRQDTGTNNAEIAAFKQ